MARRSILVNSPASPKPPVIRRVGLRYYLFNSSSADLDALNVYSEVGHGTQHGISRLQLPLGEEHWLVNDPHAIQQVLKTNQHNYVKGSEYRTLATLAPEGLLVADGDTWLQHRRMMQPAFSRDSVGALAHAMVGETDSMLRRWYRRSGDDRYVNLYPEVRDLTLSIVTRSLFSLDMSHGLLDLVTRAFNYLNWYLDNRIGEVLSLPRWIPDRKNLRYRRAIRELDAAVFHVLSQRHAARRRYAHAAPPVDLLEMLLNARDSETDRALTDSQIRDQVLTLLVAGYDTTANALAWAFYLLSTNPDVDAALHREAVSVLGGRAPTAADYNNLSYTRMVMDEVLRLYPPVWAISRTPLADDEIDGFHVPANTHLILSPYVTHRHPRYWDDPDEFRPERFSAYGSEDRPAFAHFPFGGGARQCIGRGFAQMEITLILAHVLQHYRLEYDSDTALTTEALLTLRPRGDLRMRLIPR